MITLALERLLIACFAAYAAIGVGGAVAMLMHHEVPGWLLPVAGLCGLVMAWRHHRPNPPPTGPIPAWALGAALLLVATLVAAVAYGALATQSRDWDGAVAWDLKAEVLTVQPSLEQPFFRDAAVYCHSRDYPLLQPLAIALANRAGLPGRWLFPFAYLLLVATIAAATRRTGGSLGKALLCGTACAVTPMFVSPNGGAFDSGYGDGVLTAAIAATAFGVAAKLPRLVAVAMLAAVLQKPEGLPYAALLVAACLLASDRASLRAATFALCVGGTLLLSLQHDLNAFGATSIVGPCAAAAGLLGLATLLADAWLARRGAGFWPRLGLLLLALPLGVLGLATLTGHGGSLGTHLADAGRPWHRLQRLPAIGLGVVNVTLLQGRFALTFAMALAVAWVQRHSRVPSRGPALRNWLVLAVPLWCGAFLLSPIDDLAHHLRSTLPRLVMHWGGAVWCWIACQDLPGRTGKLPWLASLFRPSWSTNSKTTS